MIDNTAYKLTREESELLVELVNDHFVLGFMNETFFYFCSVKAKTQKRWDKSIFSSQFCNAIESLVQEPLAWLEIELNSRFLDKFMQTKRNRKSETVFDGKDDWNDANKKEKNLAERLFIYKLALGILFANEEMEIFGESRKVTTSSDKSKRVSATNPSISIEKVSIENEIASILKSIVNLIKEDTSKIDAVEYLKCVNCSVNLTAGIVEWESNIQCRKTKEKGKNDLDEKVKGNESNLWEETNDDEPEKPLRDTDYTQKISEKDRSNKKIQIKINKNEFRILRKRKEKIMEKRERTEDKAPKKLGKKAKRRQAHEESMKISRKSKNSLVKSHSKESDEANSANIPILTKNEGENSEILTHSELKHHQGNEGENEEGNLVISSSNLTGKEESVMEDVQILQFDQKSNSSKNNIKGNLLRKLKFTQQIFTFI